MLLFLKHHLKHLFADLGEYTMNKWKECVFGNYWVHCCIIFSYGHINVVDLVSVFFWFSDLSSCSISCGKQDNKISGYDYWIVSPPFFSVTVEILVLNIHIYGLWQMDLIIIVGYLYFSLVILFALKCILSKVNIVTPAFLCLLFAWYIYFHLLYSYLCLFM